MSDLPTLTFVLGPQTQLSLALNSVVRENRVALGKAGLVAHPSRIASPFLRRCLDDRVPSERAAEFNRETSIRPVFLSAVNFFGPPQAGLHQREMFPDAEKSLNGLGELATQPRVVMAADPLPSFYMASGSEPLEARVKQTGWEVLYELSWADLAHEIIAALPGAELMVLTPSAAARSRQVLQTLFGPAFGAVKDPHALLRASVSETGRAVLDRVTEDPKPETLEELLMSFALTPTAAEVSDRLGLDKVTVALLEQRFQEDLAAILAMPRTSVL